MKHLFCALALTAAPLALAAESFYSQSAETIDGKKESLSKFKGKVALVVNTASQCGYTPQYKGLEEVYQKYKDRGFVVMGFPSNDFGSQEPGGNQEIKKFCEKKFKVSFPLYSKAAVTGDAKQPVYKFLTETGNPGLAGDVSWNFEKFLINRKGEIVARYKSSVAPTAPELDAAIQQAIVAK